jgi:hypothetical protein
MRAEGGKSKVYLVRRIGQALRLQAQGRFAGAPHAARIPCCAPRPAASTAVIWTDESKNKGPVLAHGAFVFGFWWRRRESNPRPEALYRQFYILSAAI